MVSLYALQVYLTCMELISRLAGKGLIHCDFNEFNLMLNAQEEVGGGCRG